MKIQLLVIGKTDEVYLREGLDIFLNRIVHYIPFEMRVLPDVKNTRKLSEEQQKEREGELIVQQ
jgi:23S rRNA (pseudouridine1915-N3)-methyltransferase